MTIRSKITWIGVIIVGASVTVFGSWYAWLQTRSTRPVYIPIALTQGEIKSGGFKINLSGQYTLAIEAKKTIPFDTLNCLLGVLPVGEQKCDRVSVVRASWTLTDSGKVIKESTSDTDDVGSWSQKTIERELGTFWLQRGRSYTIRVQSLDDGRSLATTDPHLKIEIHPDFYEGTMFTGYFLLTWCKRAMIVGCATVALSGLTWAWQKRKTGQRPSKVLSE
jgi:hypothetical protein